MGQGSIYGRRDHCQSEYDLKHSEPKICNFYVQKIKISNFMYTTELFYVAQLKISFPMSNSARKSFSVSAKKYSDPRDL